MSEARAKSMIEAAERRGDLRPGGRVVEYTGGSTGSSLAMVCAMRGYRAHFVSSDGFAAEKLQTMRAYGAEIIPVTDAEGTSSLEHLEQVIEERIAGPGIDAFYTCGSNRLLALLQRIGKRHGIAGEIALERAFEVASHFSAPLIAVHTWNASAAHGIVAFPEFTDWAGVEREEAAGLAESLAGWTDKYPDVAVERVVHQGNATKTLVDRSARSQLVVVGSRGRGVLARTFLGSTSSNLAHHGQCPVMICRDGQ